jgi:Trk K+ transport system NAD-binding subunit
LSELDLRRVSGVMVVAVVRDGKAFPNPEPDLLLGPGDDLVLVGSHAEIDRAYEILEPSPGEAEPGAAPSASPPSLGLPPAGAHP